MQNAAATKVLRKGGGWRGRTLHVTLAHLNQDEPKRRVLTFGSSGSKRYSGKSVDSRLRVRDVTRRTSLHGKSEVAGLADVLRGAPMIQRSVADE